MNRTTLIAAALAVLVVTTGFAAAAPGNAPVSVGTSADDADDESHANDPADVDRRGNGADADDRNGQGPNVDLPEQVPDHVSAIHERISAFLNGALDGTLGDAVSDLTPGDEETEADGDGSDEEIEADEPGDADETDESDEGDERNVEHDDEHDDEPAESNETDEQTDG